MFASLVRSGMRLTPRRSAVRRFSSGIVQHRETADNNAKQTFDFSADNAAEVQRILRKFPTNYRNSAVLPLLTLAQEQNDNFLTLAAMNRVASICNVPPIRVYEVATFYTMYNRTRVGKYHIQLCGTTPCQLCGAEEISRAIEAHLGIHSGDTTEDGMFTLTEVECLGACANAPMIQVNNHEYYENLTPKSAVALLDAFRSGKRPAVGPQNGQRVASGPHGKTSLFEDPTADPQKHFRSAKQIQEIEAAKAKQAKP